METTLMLMATLLMLKSMNMATRLEKEACRGSARAELEMQHLKVSPDVRARVEASEPVKDTRFEMKLVDSKHRGFRATVESQRQFL